MDKPQSWPPIPKDCSQIYCSYYCPQWCFFLFPPPPPPPPLSSSSHPLLSPLLIAVISITATGFLLAAYYILLTQYRRRRNHPTRSAPLPENQPESWHGTQPGGLDQTLINKITACQYRAGAGLIVDGTDCSVCLGQFEDGDRIRLLPKCSHPFHVPCIDTWLKSHSTCPLCRAGVFPRADEALAVVVEEILDPGPTTLTDDSGSERETVVGVEVSEGSRRLFGRSFSMDLPFRREPVSEPDRVKRSWSLPSGERSSSESQHDASC